MISKNDYKIANSFRWFLGSKKNKKIKKII